MLEKYKKDGWVHIKSAITQNQISILRTKAIQWREWVDSRIGKPAKFGPPIHWKGLGCAGAYDDYLMNFYRSDLMYKYSSALLGTKDVWLYNDQLVVKLAKDNFQFKTHTDNETKGTNSVNMCVILDDFTDLNGTLQINNQKIYPKAGDIVAIHGDTPHSSKPNTTDKPRCLYACVYTDSQVIFQNFYKTPFNINPVQKKLI